METNKIKETVYWWFDFLHGKPPQDQGDFQRLEQNFGPFDENESPKKRWDSIQKVCKQIWFYRESYGSLKRFGRFSFYAERFCRLRECPIHRAIDDNCDLDNMSADDDEQIFNLIVGPKGQLSSGTPKNFVDAIIERLGIVGNITEAYFHDPYIIKSLTRGHATNFAKDFLEELRVRLTPLTIVSRENHSGATSLVTVPFKRIADKVLHDRLLIVCNDGAWRGVSIGSSVNAFPVQSDDSDSDAKPHFIITKLEDADAPLIATVIKNNLIS